jgi:hypothetical protein
MVFSFFNGIFNFYPFLQESKSFNNNFVYLLRCCWTREQVEYMYKTSLHSLKTPTKTTLGTSTEFSRLRRWWVASACCIGSVCLNYAAHSQVHQIQEEHELVMTNLSWLSLMSLWCSPFDLRWRSSLLAFYKWYHFDQRCNIFNKRILNFNMVPSWLEFATIRNLWEINNFTKFIYQLLDRLCKRIIKGWA